MNRDECPGSNLMVLLVEDEPDMRLGCTQAMDLDGIPSRAVASVEEARPLLQPGFPGVVITDMKLPGEDGLALIKFCRQLDAELPVVMITGHGDVRLAVEAMRNGAYDFITKPFSRETLLDVTRRALEKRRLTLEVLKLRQSLADLHGFERQLVGASEHIKNVRTLTAELAASPIDVLISGETGTGKEVVAQALHTQSDRRQGPFVAINCGAMSDQLLDGELFGHEPGAMPGALEKRIGKIEFANGGTLFLDELESMSISMQMKLLRVIQDRKIERIGSNEQLHVDVRIIAATKINLLQAAQEGTFRADLYYRLNIASVKMAPLRERREDIPVLLNHFLLLASSRYARPLPDISQAQQNQLLAHDWPGNVRELKNIAECLVLNVPCGVITRREPDADPDLDNDPGLVEMVENFEKAIIESVLVKHSGNASLSARSLKVPKTTLADKLRKYNLSTKRDDGQPAATRVRQEDAAERDPQEALE